MGKLMEHILKPPEGEGDQDHLTDIDLARLAEGQVTEVERRDFLAHLAGCSLCHEILKETLSDISPHLAEKSSLTSRIKRFPYALAASLAVFLLLGGGLFLKTTLFTPQILTASLALDPGLKALLVESDDQVWSSRDRVDRLAGLLRDKGVKIKSLDKVVMTAPYQPSKSFIAPKEKLKVRIENGVAYLEVIEDKDQ
ncbi:MAG: hypothetical protein AB1641_30805 [Thermodesulfobacteriota bacterium]